MRHRRSLTRRRNWSRPRAGNPLPLRPIFVTGLAYKSAFDEGVSYFGPGGHSGRQRRDCAPDRWRGPCFCMERHRGDQPHGYMEHDFGGAAHAADGGSGGSIVIISSSAGLRATAGLGIGTLAYTSAKTGLVGLMKQLAASLAPESIRVNSLHPTGVKSGMTMNEAMGRLVAQAMEGADTSISAMQNAMPIDILEPEDVANTVAFLVSDQAKWITGVALPVDAGFCVR